MVEHQFSRLLAAKVCASVAVIKLTPVSTREGSEIIKSLKWKNSHGYDEIPIKILKISLPYIMSPLTYICNRSSTGIFPT